jgi:hypothetical protein
MSLYPAEFPILVASIRISCYNVCVELIAFLRIIFHRGKKRRFSVNGNSWFSSWGPLFGVNFSCFLFAFDPVFTNIWGCKDSNSHFEKHNSPSFFLFSRLCFRPLFSFVYFNGYQTGRRWGWGGGSRRIMTPWEKNNLKYGFTVIDRDSTKIWGSDFSIRRHYWTPEERAILILPTSFCIGHQGPNSWVNYPMLRFEIWLSLRRFHIAGGGVAAPWKSYFFPF